MTFNLHTYDIQDLIIALIMRDKENDPDGMAERLARMDALLTDMNNMCSPANDYTLTVTVEPARHE